MRRRAFTQVDVFAGAPLGGNPVAVVLDAEGMDEVAMARFATWMNLSETTYVLPPTEAGADYRVRIFTPTTELPFAGHPTLGTAHAWLQANSHGRDEVVQECGAGLVPVRRGLDGLAFAAPPLLRYEQVSDGLLADLTKALGLAPYDVMDASWVDNGPGWVALLLGSAQAVLDVRPGFLDMDIGLVGLHPDGTPEVRGFFPKDGVLLEDPVTGSLNASVAQWLLDSGRIEAPYVAHQGTALGRSGRVHVGQDDDGQIWVGGTTVTSISGMVTL